MTDRLMMCLQIGGYGSLLGYVVLTTARMKSYPMPNIGFDLIGIAGYAITSPLEIGFGILCLMAARYLKQTKKTIPEIFE